MVTLLNEKKDIILIITIILKWNKIKINWKKILHMINNDIKWFVLMIQIHSGNILEKGNENNTEN